MDFKHRSAQLAGWLAILVGSVYALFLVVTLFIGQVTLWLLVSKILFISFAAYLIHVGRRAIRFAQKRPLPVPRFGWGRIVIGALFLFSSANQRFQLTGSKQVIQRLEPSNQTQAVAMQATSVVLAFLWLILICWGIARGFRHPSVDELKTVSTSQ